MIRDEPFYRGGGGGGGKGGYHFLKNANIFLIFPCCKQFILQPQHLQTIFFRELLREKFENSLEISEKTQGI